MTDPDNSVEVFANNDERVTKARREKMEAEVTELKKKITKYVDELNRAHNDDMRKRITAEINGLRTILVELEAILAK